MPGRLPIVLLTDFGTKDAYVGSMKGVMAGISPGTPLIDLTHEIKPQNVRQAAFVLKAAYPYFPKGSVFVSVVDPGVGSERKILAAQTPAGTFLAPDNGLLTLVLQKENKTEIRGVTNRKFFREKVSFTFHGRDCFAPTAAHLAKNPSRFRELGPRISAYQKLNFAAGRKIGKRLVGEIVYFDHFGNAFTNLTQEDLHKRTDPFRVVLNKKSLGSIRRSYFEVPHGKVVAVFSSNGVLEIAVNQGSAREILKLKEGDPVEVL